MTRDISQPTLDDYGDDTHPAFAMIGMSRLSSMPGSVLFDSDIQHQHSVTVRISTATRKRDLNRDWLHTRREFLEVEMSEAQWASFVSSANVGSGVPCTIRYRDGQVPGLPYEPRLAESMRETHEAAERAFAAIREALAAYDDTPASPVGLKRQALANLRTAINHATLNVDFAGKSLVEHAENVVQKARADVEAFVTAKATQLGLNPSDVGSPLQIGTGS